MGKEGWRSISSLSGPSRVGRCDVNARDAQQGNENGHDVVWWSDGRPLRNVGSALLMAVLVVVMLWLTGSVGGLGFLEVYHCGGAGDQR